MTWTARRALIGDVALAAGVTTFLVAVSPNIEPSSGERAIDALGYVILLTAGLSLAFTRWAPRAVLGVLVVVLVLYTRRFYAGGPIYLTMAVPLYRLAAHAVDRRAALQPAAIAVAVMTAGGTIGMESIEWTWHVAVFPGWAAAALFLGEASRNRRAYLRGLEERARNLEETRDEEARRRVAEERLRIARDLHDVVAHTIATVNLQAGVAAHVLARRPEQAGEALEAIKRASGDALNELRATLDVLRSDGDDDAPRAPTPGLDRVDALAERARQAGLPVTVSRIGDTGRLPAAVDVAAFRIVQESITNVMRHAGASQATVTLRHAPDAIELEVTDDGRGASVANGDGHGIAGMRERAALVGGSLDVGPLAGGGFRVWARLPIGDAT